MTLNPLPLLLTPPTPLILNTPFVVYYRILGVCNIREGGGGRSGGLIVEGGEDPSLGPYTRQGPKLQTQTGNHPKKIGMAHAKGRYAQRVYKTLACRSPGVGFRVSGCAKQSKRYQEQLEVQV